MLFWSFSFGQIGQDLQLAEQFYNEGEYEKAAELYSKSYDRNNTDYVYSGYLRCLMSMRDFNGAEKLVKKQTKKYPDNHEYLVDLGYVYAAEGEASKAKEQYSKAIKEARTDRGSIMNIANRFVSYKEIEYAIETYQRGKKEGRGDYSFNYELAELYFSRRDFDNMIEEYFQSIETNPGNIYQVQNYLQGKMDLDVEGKNYEKLRIALLKKIQKFPDRSVFAELLLWYFIQQKDFESAFVQAKALDMRNREDGRRLFTLADLARSNDDFEAAMTCYDYLINKGTSFPFYIKARVEYLDVMNQKITNKPEFSKQELYKLEADFERSIVELGRDHNTVELLLGIAHLKAFYLFKTEEAISLLQEGMNTAGIPGQLNAMFKLELADILLYTGDIWEATLLYSQVDKSFKDEPLGKEAKYRNARLSFYTGEFEWALAQLDVLKNSTSQLIANDALALSLIITDNTAFDTTTDALMLFAEADLLSFRNQDSAAVVLLDSLLKTFSDHPLADDALFEKFKIRKKQKRFKEGTDLLEEIVKRYSYGIVADDALYNWAIIMEQVFKDYPKAMELYKRILIEYPASSFVVDARKKFRSLRGDSLLQ